VSHDKLIEIAESIYQNNSVDAIKVLDELTQAGKEAPRLVQNLIQFYRDMLIFKNTNVEEDEQIIFANPEFKELSEKLSNNLIFFYIDILNQTQNDMKRTNNAKLYMELALIKMVDHIEKQELVFEDVVNELKNQIQNLRKDLEARPLVKQEPIITDVEDYQEPPIEEFEEVPVQEIIEEEEKPVSNQKPIEVTTDEQNNQEEEEDTQEADNAISLFDLPVEEKEEESSNDNQEPYKTYDIRYVEDVLNNGIREEKIELNKKWFDIERVVPADKLNYAKSITSGRVVATNGKMIIIQYANPSLCNRMMKPEVKEIVVKLLSDYYNKPLDYLALPTVVWEEKSQEFIKKWKQNKDGYIRLTPIDHPMLKEMPKFTKEVSEFTPDSVKDAINLFGSDAVRIKKGE
jgi:DNA polymerase-3 subunit gamma/tau